VSERLRNALNLIKERPATGTGLMTVRISDLLDRSLVYCTPDTSIRKAARIMTENRVSSLVVMDGERLAGIITDRDLRSRCIAAGLLYEDPVYKIMTENLHTTEADTLGFQALIAMTRLNVHHLPVPYAWMAGGSQARREQSPHSDQDNALLIADHAKPEDDAYFAALADIVNDGLDACGYYYWPSKAPTCACTP